MSNIYSVLAYQEAKKYNEKKHPSVGTAPEMSEMLELVARDIKICSNYNYILYVQQSTGKIKPAKERHKTKFLNNPNKTSRNKNYI